MLPEEIESNDRFVVVAGVSNLRDVGGYRTNDGRYTVSGIVYRSGDLSRLQRPGQPQINALNLSRIIDLRSADERTRAAGRWFDPATRPETILLPIGGSVADWSSDLSQELQRGGFTEQRLREIFVAMYASVPLDNADKFKALFAEILASEGQPLLFHCTAGKDRTGIAAALLLTALDVPRDTVMQDFLASNDAVDVERMSTMLARVFSAQSGTPVDARAVRPMLTVEPIYLETAFATIEDRYGTVDRYLAEALGLDAQKRLRLTQLLLD